MVGGGGGVGASLLENANPLIYERSGERPVTAGEEDEQSKFEFSMATLIGLSIKVKLLRSLPQRFKMDVHITPGTHASEHAVNKQLADKERVAAALENTHLLEVRASDAMTLNGGGSGAGGSHSGGRERERRRGSTPWGPATPLHRRSMPVDERDLQAALAPGALAGAAAESRAQGPRPDWREDSSESLSSGGSDSDESVYKVLLLGAPGVGKSALARIFGGVEDGPEAEAAGHTYDRSIMVDGEEASLMVYDIWEQDGSRWLPGHCMAMGDAYVIVYSVTDKGSFEKASELRVQLRRARQTDDVPIILVGNKSDLVRSREVSLDEGRACAVVFDCKFIETSAALHHNVQALFEGVVRQIRLRRDSKEDNARRQAGTRRRESLGKKAKRFLGRMVARNSRKMAFRAKSKSCHDLSVL
ncbi:hypothetical protein MC885_019381 [Smutsia gigantea]|nr:hypothetical protein MC885_019381 [Smutsia gigantea]